MQKGILNAARRVGSEGVLKGCAGGLTPLTFNVEACTDDTGRKEDAESPAGVDIAKAQTTSVTRLIVRRSGLRSQIVSKRDRTNLGRIRRR